MTTDACPRCTLDPRLDRVDGGCECPLDAGDVFTLSLATLRRMPAADYRAEGPTCAASVVGDWAEALVDERERERVGDIWAAALGPPSMALRLSQAAALGLLERCERAASDRCETDWAAE